MAPIEPAAAGARISAPLERLAGRAAGHEPWGSRPPRRRRVVLRIASPSSCDGGARWTTVAFAVGPCDGRTRTSGQVSTGVRAGAAVDRTGTGIDRRVGGRADDRDRLSREGV